MTVQFFKYQGTGNDFIIIDRRQYKVSKNDTKTIRRLCDRKFGVGADGLIFLEESDNANEDFTMIYYNADGNESTLCGNGGRCLVSFAKHIGIIKDKTVFRAIDGPHEANINGALVSLKMQDVPSVRHLKEAIFLDTGSPQHVAIVNNLEGFDAKSAGAAIRYNRTYKKEGTNVNFVEKIDNQSFKMRTYERGVEDETLSCGTGATGVAIAMHASKETDKTSVNLHTKGGKLEVSFNYSDKGYTNIWLKGPAVLVFKGELEW